MHASRCCTASQLLVLMCLYRPRLHYTGVVDLRQARLAAARARARARARAHTGWPLHIHAHVHAHLYACIHLHVFSCVPMCMHNYMCRLRTQYDAVRHAHVRAPLCACIHLHVCPHVYAYYRYMCRLRARSQAWWLCGAWLWTCGWPAWRQRPASWPAACWCGPRGQRPWRYARVHIHTCAH